MVKLIGVLLIASSLLALMAAAYIDMSYGSESRVTGNAISNIMAHKPVDMGLFDYVAGAALAYSIMSLIAGFMFLKRFL